METENANPAAEPPPLRLEVLVGMIGSGKSTYARHRAREGALVVCHDGLTAMLHAEYRYEPGLRETYRAMEERLAASALRAGRAVVIDRTHLTRESRLRWRRFAEDVKSFGGPWPVPAYAVPFPIEVDLRAHALRRMNDDPRGRSWDDWIGVAEHHAEQARLEPLDWRAEGFAGMIDPGAVLADRIA